MGIENTFKTGQREKFINGDNFDVKKTLHELELGKTIFIDDQNIPLLKKEYTNLEDQIQRSEELIKEERRFSHGNDERLWEDLSDSSHKYIIYTNKTIISLTHVDSDRKYEFMKLEKKSTKGYELTPLIAIHWITTAHGSF